MEVKDVTGSLKTRVTNPVIGTFIIVWFIINWKFLLILFFGDSDINQRIIALESMINTNSMVIVPLVYTVVYASVAPYFVYFIRLYNLSIETRTALAELHSKAIVDSKNNELSHIIDIVKDKKEDERKKLMTERNTGN